MLLELIVASVITPIILLLSLAIAAKSELSRTSITQGSTLMLMCCLTTLVYSLCLAQVSAQISWLMSVVFGLTLAQAVTPISVVVSNRGSSRAPLVLASIAVISLAGLALVLSQTQLSLVLSFELMLFGALSLLKLTAKAERALEAIVEMYVWSVFGSFALVTSLWLGASEFAGGAALVSGLLTLVGFAVKIPLWPFSSWLLKAHVEASTEFSILLSGYLVKFGVIGLYKAVVIAGAHDLVIALLRSLAWVGMLESAVRLYYQVDLKRLIATLTILETNWLVLCLASDSARGVSLGLALVLVHCWTTTAEFYLIEVIYRRYSSRSLLRVSGMWWANPNIARLSWLVVMVTLGLPGTSIFALKFLFMAHVASVSILQLVVFSLIMLVLVPISLIRVWAPTICGQPSEVTSAGQLTRAEFVVLSSSLVCGLVVGFVPAAILS